MYRKNVASQFVHFQGVDATTGGIKSGVTWTMRRCIDGTFAAGGGTVTEDGTAGWYKCALTQADTNGNNIAYNFTGTGAVPQTVNIVTTACDPTTATNFGITALPATAVTTNASLLTSGTGSDQLSVTSGRIDVGKALGTAVTLDANNVLNVSAKYVGGTLQTARDIGLSVLLSAGSGTGQLDFTSGVVKANLAQILGTALTETAGQIAAAFKQFFNIATPAATMDHLILVDTVTTYTGNTKQTGDAFARLGAPAGASVSADIAAIKSDSGAIKTQTDKLTFTVANQIDANVLDWKSATAPAMTGDAFARLGAPAGASVSADVAAVKVDTAAVKVQTDKLTFTVANKIDANVLALNGDATSAANIAKTTRAVARCTASGVPTTTSIPTSACAPTGVDADQFKGRLIIFDADTATTNLRGQMTDITANTAAATPTFTCTALTVAPASGDTFSVV